MWHGIKIELYNTIPITHINTRMQLSQQKHIRSAINKKFIRANLPQQMNLNVAQRIPSSSSKELIYGCDNFKTISRTERLSHDL